MADSEAIRRLGDQLFSRAAGAPLVAGNRTRGARGSATRAAAGALRIGSALGSALAARRVHGPAERRLMAQGGILLAIVAGVGFVWPRVLALAARGPRPLDGDRARSASAAAAHVSAFPARAQFTGGRSAVG